MKKLLALALALIFVFSSISALAYSDVPASGEMSEAVTRLGDLGIVSGYTDNTYRPGNNLTRAEFARMMVSALGKDKEAKALSNMSVFSDVKSGSWSAPYINYVASMGIVSGYLDGTYKPNQNITYAECVTILLRCLNFMENTVGYYWPTNYVEAAKTEGIGAGMNYGAYDAITRGDAAIMIDRAIFSEFNGEERILLENSGYRVIRDAVVIESGDGTVRLSDSNTYTEKMTSTPKKGQFASYAVIDEDGYLIALSGANSEVSSAKANMPVYVTAVTGNTVSYISNGIAGSYTFSGGFTVYVDGMKTTYQGANMKAGCDLTFYGDSFGAWNFAVVDTLGNDPKLSSKNYTDSDTAFEGIALNKKTLTVYRDGSLAEISDIKKNDVVYFNELTNVMDVYTKKVTGIYYDAMPSKTYVEKVKVAGAEYTVGSSQAALKLSASPGSYEIGERITLLLGKNDEVQFVVELSDAAVSNYGVVLSTGTETGDTGATERYANIFMSDGETHKITVKSDASGYIGKLVNITYKDSLATLSLAKKPSGLSGTLNKTERTLNGKTILKEAVIIQRTRFEEGKVAECEVLNLATMTAKSISDTQILGAAVANGFGDIALLYVEDVETTSEFGIVSGITKLTDGGRYEIFQNGFESEYSANFFVSGLSVGTPVEFSVGSAGLLELKKLYKIASGAVNAADDSRIMIGSTVYELSPEVVVIDVSTIGEYKTVSLEDLKDGTIKNAAVYSDTSSTNEAVIRVITVKKG